MSESQHQKAVVKWFRMQYPKYAYNLFAIPNGSVLAGNSRQRAMQMQRLKLEGFVNGVSDLFLMLARQGYHGLFIEMKDAGKTACSVSEAQQNHIEAARQAGYMAEWCAGAEQAIELIEGYVNG